ncbi:MAG: hypothetical protein AB7F40_03500 [Victivallaceae bacterium]
MVTRKQKITIAITLFTTFGFGMATMCGCSSFTEEKAAAVSKAIGTTLNIAYTAGGATLVEQRIDQLAADGKITPEQAVQLKAAAQKSYDELQKKLAEFAAE